MKICLKCKIEKDLSEFSKDKKNRKDKLQIYCKQCTNKYHKEYYEKNKENIDKKHREYYDNNREKRLKQVKKYYEKNKEQIAKRGKKYRVNNPGKEKLRHKIYYENNKNGKIAEYYEDNKGKIKVRNKEYRNNKTNFIIYASQISYAEKIRNVDEFLQTKCTYCGKWYYPTVQEIQSRIKALNGQQSSNGAECRLYCSTKCKQECPIYRKRLFQEGHPLKNKNSSREVQPELRQMVFERDEYICIKCGKHQDELDVPLHCHHIEGILWNPLESADIDMCVTVCKTCHDEIHQQKDCGYNDMKCNKKT